MTVTTDKPTLVSSAELPAAQQRRGFLLMVLSTMSAFVGDEVFAGNILIVTALSFQATDGFIGLLWFLILGGSLTQLFIVGYAQQVSKKKFLYGTYGAAMLLGLPVLGLQWMSIHQGVRAALLLLAVCVGLRQFVYSTATPSWMALLREMTPADRRGRWLALLRMAWQSVVVLTLVLTGFYLGKHPEWPRLQTMIVLGLLGQLVRILCLIPVPSSPTARSARSAAWWSLIRIPIQDPAFRLFLLYTAFYGLAFGLQDGFRLVYLVRLGFGKDLALVCSSLTALGAVITLFFWGHLSDRFGNNGVFSLTLIGFTACVFSWLFVTGHRTGLILAMGLFLVAGAFNSGNFLVHTRYLLAASKPHLEVPYIAITYVALQLSTGFGALLGGQILTLAQKKGFKIGGSGLNQYHIIFILAALLFVVPWFLRRRLRAPADSSTRELVAVVLQPVRNLVGTLVLWARGEDKDGD
jgi:MFS family permease